MRKLAALFALLLALALPTRSQATYLFDEICQSSNAATGITLTCGPFTVAAGSQLTGGLKWEANPANTISTVATDVGDTCTLGTAIANTGGTPNEPIIQMFKCPVAVGGDTTFTVTQSGVGGAYRVLKIAEHTRSGTSTYDTAPAGAEGTGTTATSGTFSTANAVELVVGFVGGYAAQTFSAPLVGGNAANLRGSCVSPGPDTCLFDYITSSAISSGTVALSQSASNRWTIAAMAFYESGGGGGGGAPQSLTTTGMGK